MEKFILVVMLFMSVLYADNNIFILSGDRDSDVAEILIKGNGEECKVSMYSMGELIKTNCLQLTNSKKVKILCTKNKKMCKTQEEVREAIKNINIEDSIDYSKNLRTYNNGDGRFSFSVQYPAVLLPELHLDGEGYGAWFQSDEEGTVAVQVNGIDATGIHDVKQAYKDAINWRREDTDIEVTYKVQKQNWFVISGYNHKYKTTFYEKRYFLKDSYKGNSIVGFNIKYPTKDKKKYENIVNIVAKSFKPVNEVIKQNKIKTYQKDIDVTEMLIKGNGEECKVSMDRTGVIVKTNCIQLTNSKGIKILCTKKKKICKTIGEVRNAFSIKGVNISPISKVEKNSPSFDCTKASTQTEYDICNSDKVSNLDSKLGNIYLTIKSEMSNESFQSLIAIQREWVKERDSKCNTQSDFSERERCLIKAYKERLDAFSMLSVIGAQVDHVANLFPEVYENGTGEERFELAAYLYHEQKNIKKSSKLLRKIIADNQEYFLGAFIALNDIHKDYAKNFPQVSKKLLEDNDGSIGLSLLDLNATHDEVINVLIEEGYLLNTPAQIMLRIKYQYPIEGQPIYDKRILSFYEECAGEGMPRCEVYLGNIYMNGWGVKKNIDKGIHLLKQSELGDAYISLAEYYYNQKNVENCKKYSQKAAELGEAMGMHNLGILAQEEKQYEDAIKYFTASLELDNAYYPSMMELSRMYIEGVGTEINYGKAIDMLQIIIDNSNELEMQQNAIQNLSIAEYRLGMKYFTDKDSNKTKAFILIKKSAESGYPEGQALYGALLLEEDDDEATDWLEKAAKQGNKVAKDALRELAVRLNSIAIPSKSHSFKKALKVYEDKSKEEAFPLMESLAKKGDPDAQAYLGEMYDHGHGVKKDKEKAEYWYGKAAVQNNAMGIYGLGEIIDYGNRSSLLTPPIGKARDEAIKLYEKSAALGYADAASGLAYLYSKFSDKNYNPEKSIYWAEQKAKLGTAYDKMYVGGKFIDEIWFPMNPEKSKYWFKKAYDEFLISADSGDGYAQSIIGSMNYYGQGVRKNIQKAIKYLKLSLKSKDTFFYYDTTRLLEKIEKETSYNNRIQKVDNVFGIVIGDKVSNVTQKKIPTGDKTSLALSMDIEIPNQAKELGFERAVLAFTPNEKRIVWLTVSSKTNSNNKKIFENVKRLLEDKYGVFLYEYSEKDSFLFIKKINDIIIKILLVEGKGVSLSYMSETNNQLFMKEISEFKWADKYGL